MCRKRIVVFEIVVVVVHVVVDSDYSADVVGDNFHLDVVAAIDVVVVEFVVAQFVVVEFVVDPLIVVVKFDDSESNHSVIVGLVAVPKRVERFLQIHLGVVQGVEMVRGEDFVRGERFVREVGNVETGNVTGNEVVIVDWLGEAYFHGSGSVIVIVILLVVA